jgi:uncharacterized membrane protein
MNASPPASGADTPRIIYILYLAGLIIGLTALIGLVMAYVNRGDAPDWVASHYRFQIRTFWIGLLYALVGIATSFVVIGFVILLFAVVWWIVRCAKGLQSLSRGEPYKDETTWLW